MNLYHYITPDTTACEKRIELSKIKMGKKCPACDLQRSSPGGLLLTCLTLIAFCVTSTSGLDQVQDTASTQPSPALPGMNMTGQFSRFVQPASPPTTATFEMECTSPAGDVYGLCWLDNNTMIWVHGRSNKVVNVSVNRQNKSCSYRELKSPTKPERVACCPETGEIYVTSYTDESVWVYDRNSLKAVWKPEGLVGKPRCVAINRERIVVGTYTAGPLYVYGRNRVYIGQVSIFQNKHRFVYTELTEEGQFVASTYDTHRLIIHELGTGLTVTIGGQGSENGQFGLPCDVSIVGNNILVADDNNNRVPVFGTNVGFHGNLQFKGTYMQRPRSLAYRSETKLLAIKINISPFNNVKIFSLT